MIVMRFEMKDIRFVSLDEGHGPGLKSQEDEDIHYASLTVAGSSQGADKHASSKVLDRNSTVIYSAIKAQ